MDSWSRHRSVSRGHRARPRSDPLTLPPRAPVRRWPAGQHALNLLRKCSAATLEQNEHASGLREIEYSHLGLGITHPKFLRALSCTTRVHARWLRASRMVAFYSKHRLVSGNAAPACRASSHAATMQVAAHIIKLCVAHRESLQLQVGQRRDRRVEQTGAGPPVDGDRWHCCRRPAGAIHVMAPGWPAMACARSDRAGANQLSRALNRCLAPGRRSECPAAPPSWGGSHSERAGRRAPFS